MAKRVHNIFNVRRYKIIGMAERKGVVKETILKILEKEGCMEVDALVEKVAKELGVENQPTKVRAIKAVISKMVKRQQLKKKGNEVCLK